LAYQARGRAREAALAAWRVRQFGGDFDPVRAVVEDAVAAFSRRQPTMDRALWLKVANIIGWETFRKIYFEQLSVMVDSARRGHPLRNPAAAFHKKLQALVRRSRQDRRVQRRRRRAELAMRHHVGIEAVKMRCLGHLKKISFFFKAQ
jgi:hypothetical protein